MFYSLSFLGLLISLTNLPASLSLNCSAPVNVVLWDQFGDTWNGAQWFVEYPDGNMTSRSPDCNHNPLILRKDASSIQDGLYFMTVNTPDNSIPAEWWEIFWTVHFPNQNDEFYTGGFNTTMVFSFSKDECKFNLVHYLNLWNNTKSCDGCGHSKKCPPPKPKPPPKPDKPKPEEKPEDKAEKPAEVEQEPAEEQKEKPAYGPPAVNVAVEMYDQEDDGWWQNDYLGTSWYIYDTGRTELFESGTLCDGAYGKCDVCLGDGSYIYRATYNKFLNLSASDDADKHAHDASHNDWRAWQFCGVSGHYSDELHFHIEKGKCFADGIRRLDDIYAASCSAHESFESKEHDHDHNEASESKQQVELKEADSINGSSYDFASIAYIMAAIGMGLIAVATVLSRRMSSYSKLQDESAHVDVTESSQSLEFARPAVRDVNDRSKLAL